MQVISEKPNYRKCNQTVKENLLQRKCVCLSEHCRKMVSGIK